jgi:hypothetical protein
MKFQRFPFQASWKNVICGEKLAVKWYMLVFNGKNFVPGGGKKWLVR